MSLLQEEINIIVQNKYADNFDFAEIEEFIKGTSKKSFYFTPLKHKRRCWFNQEVDFLLIKNVFTLWVFCWCKCRCITLYYWFKYKTKWLRNKCKMLKLSEENEVDMLNGYPLVNHGYRTSRKNDDSFW